MKFVKGMLIGTLLSAGVVMMYSETMNGSKKKVDEKRKENDSQNGNYVRTKRGRHI